MSRKRPNSRIELDDLPRVALLFTGESIFLSRFDERGVPVSSYPVSAQAVASALNPFGVDTGLLSLDTLFWQSRGADPRIGVYLPPARRRLLFDSARRVQALDVPLPGLVFVGHRNRYFVWASKSRPQDEADPLYLAPFPNIYGDGSICPGNAPFPRCEGRAMAQAVRVFFESSFNTDLSGARVARQRGPLSEFWRGLRGKRTFPVDRLLPANLTIGDVLKGERR